MSHSLRRLDVFSVVLSCVLSCCLSMSWAKDKEAGGYPVSGKVLAVASKGAHSYQVETDSKIYLLLCEKTKGIHMAMPECKVDDKPIAAGDTVQFRVDGDLAYMPGVKGSEEELRILTTELKVIPPPAASEASSPGAERGMIIGTGVHILGQKQVGWSTNPSAFNRPVFNTGVTAPGITMASAGTPVMATGPVMAMPVTGGAPVMVMPAGPVTGGIVTGVPVTGGAPIVGMATGPVMGVPIGGAPMGAAHAGGGMVGGGRPPWVHLLRVRVGEKIYQLECDAKPCEDEKKRFALGDTILLRTEKKWAYASSASGSAEKEQKFRILGEKEDEAVPDTAPDAKLPDTKTPETK